MCVNNAQERAKRKGRLLLFATPHISIYRRNYSDKMFNF